MKSKLSNIILCFTVVGSLAIERHLLASNTLLTADQLANKNVDARGGLKAWRSIESISFSGTIGAGGNQRAALPMVNQVPGHHSQTLVPSRPVKEVQLPFVMELKRPRKMRFELQFAGQTALQVFDGNSGWKLRPYLNRRTVEPYTSDEMLKASQQAELDGRLVDYLAKGTRVELDGTEKVENRDNYKLKLTLKNGNVVHEWIDAETFLETKIEGTPRRLDGVDHPVEVFLRDYREIGGVRIPFVIETRVLPVTKTGMGSKDMTIPPERLVIERAIVNPKLDDSLFSKTQLVAASVVK
jgi:outer membrane lipoprotein-sorting protein